MSRSGYADDYGYGDNCAFGRWCGAVKSAIKGKRGQGFLRDLLAALRALPDRKLIAGKMEYQGYVCAIAAVGKARGMDMTELDKLIEENEEEDCWGSTIIGKEVADAFGIASALAREIMYENDEGGRYDETDEGRYQRMVGWVESLLRG